VAQKSERWKNTAFIYPDDKAHETNIRTKSQAPDQVIIRRGIDAAETL
jgi:hypothetical protein